MRIPAFNPRVLEQDKPEVVKAYAVCHIEKNKIYSKTNKVKKLAAMRRRPDLAEAVERWSILGDRIVSTNFDIVHFRAQIKHRYDIGRQDLVPELEATLEKVRKLNEESMRDYPAAQEALERLFAEVAGRETVDGGDGDQNIIRLS